MSERGAERRLAAIVAIDVAGYSRLMGADEAGTLAALKGHRAAIEPIGQKHGGRIVGIAGDGLLLEFPSVVEAASFAVETQGVMAERNADIVDDQKMLYRIGINLGDVLVDGDDIYGDGVNVAARLEGLAEPGGICISGSVHEQVHDKIDIAFDDRGDVEVKNITRPVHVWRWVAEGQAAASPAGADGPLPLPDKPSIAVLPFDNMSRDPEQEYFADGLTEDIITALAAWRWFPVTARHSTFAYKGTKKPLSQIAQELHARYVVEGSVRRAGDKIRVTAQLIDATTDHHIWAKRYDREIRDIFALQDEITENIVTSIEPELGKAERTRASRKRPENLDSWDLTLRAQASVFQFTTKDNEQAFSLLEKALELDPESALVMSMLALCHYKDAILGFSTDKGSSLAQARQAAERAVSLDDRDWLAHAVLGITLMWTERGFERALEHEERAMALNPSSTWARAFLSCVLEFGGAPDRAVPELQVALRLDPHSPFATFINADLAISYFLLRQFEESINYARRALDISPANVRARQRLAASLGQAGRIEEAQTALDQLLRHQPDFSIAYIDETYPFRYPEDRALFIGGLRKAGLPE
jgi:TolB-like protein/Flp pilus assembly protein TadD